MKLVIPPITVNKGMGFEKDLFGRQGFGEALNNILKQCKDPLVISIDGNWGEGKSTFVRMWQDLLDKDNIPNIYIDAFANDHTDDPFMVVASAVHDYAEEYVSKDLAEKFAEKAKKAGAKILPWAGKMLIKTLSLGIVKSSDIDEAKEIIEEITDDFGESAEKMIHEKLQNHKHDVATINSFKHFLSEMPKMIGDKNAPLTIIIDELDRCRPSFAVETLEKIKHLFSVPNIAFVLVINKPQLEESIKATYGLNIDAHTYLQKFITIDAQLPKPKRNSYGGDMRNYCESLHRAHELAVDEQDLTSCMWELGQHFNFTLRQMEKAYCTLTLAYGTFPRPNQEMHLLIALGAAIKIASPSTFSKLVNQTISHQELFKELNYQPGGEEDDRVTLFTIMNWVKYCLLTDAEYNLLKNDPEVQSMDQWRHGSRYNILARVLRPLSTFTQN